MNTSTKMAPKRRELSGITAGNLPTATSSNLNRKPFPQTKKKTKKRMAQACRCWGKQCVRFSHGEKANIVIKEVRLFKQFLMLAYVPESGSRGAIPQDAEQSRVWQSCEPLQMIDQAEQTAWPAQPPRNCIASGVSGPPHVPTAVQRIVNWFFGYGLPPAEILRRQHLALKTKNQRTGTTPTIYARG